MSQRRRAPVPTPESLRAARESAHDDEGIWRHLRTLSGLVFTVAVVAATIFAGRHLSQPRGVRATEADFAPREAARAREPEREPEVAAPTSAAASPPTAARVAPVSPVTTTAPTARAPRQVTTQTVVTLTEQRVETPRQQRAVRWEDGADAYRRADSTFMQGSKPLLLYFHTDWCGYCKAIDRTIWQDGQVADVLAQRYTAIRINPEDGPEAARIAQSFGVSGYPTVLIKSSPSARLLRLPVVERSGPVSAAGLVQTLVANANP